MAIDQEIPPSLKASDFLPEVNDANYYTEPLDVDYALAAVQAALGLSDEGLEKVVDDPEKRRYYSSLVQAVTECNVCDDLGEQDDFDAFLDLDDSDDSALLSLEFIRRLDTEARKVQRMSSVAFLQSVTVSVMKLRLALGDPRDDFVPNFDRLSLEWFHGAIKSLAPKSNK